MKILYISNAVIPSELSRSLSIMRVCQAFHDAGHEVELDAIAPSKSHEDPARYYGLEGGFKVTCHFFHNFLYNERTRWYLLGGLLNGLQAMKSFRRSKPDIVYSRLTISELLFLPKDVPIIYEMHSLGGLGQKWWRRKTLEWVFRNKNLKRIIVTTDVLADWLKEQFPEIEVVIARLSAEPPIDVEVDKLKTFQQEHVKGQFTHNVGYTGYLDTYGLRGTDVICQAASKMPDVGFHIVGGEPDVVDHWKEYSKDWNQHGNIYFYGYRNPNEMPLFLNIFDVVLAPLQFKPEKRAPLGQNMSPLKLPQYMGYGQAIVASDLNAHHEVLDAGRTAKIVQHDDVEAWVHAKRVSGFSRTTKSFW